MPPEAASRCIEMVPPVARRTIRGRGGEGVLLTGMRMAGDSTSSGERPLAGKLILMKNLDLEDLLGQRLGHRVEIHGEQRFVARHLLPLQAATLRLPVAQIEGGTHSCAQLRRGVP